MPAAKKPAAKLTAKKTTKETARAAQLPTSAPLAEQCQAWTTSLPRERSAAFTFSLDEGNGAFSCKLKQAFYFYFELRQISYAGDGLLELIENFKRGAVHGTVVFPAHPRAVYVPDSVRVERMPGSARAEARARLDAILSAAFPQR